MNPALSVEIHCNAAVCQVLQCHLPLLRHERWLSSLVFEAAPLDDVMHAQCVVDGPQASWDV